MIKLSIVALLFSMISSIGVLAQEISTIEVAPKKEIQIEPKAKVTCKVIKPTKFSIIVDGGTQELFSLSINDCRYSRNIAGVISVHAEMHIDLNETSDVQFCQNVRIAQLLELSSENPEFEWPAKRVLIDELSLENLNESVRDISLLSLHKKLAGKPIILSSILNDKPFQPSYDDLFWGEVVVFQEPDGATFSRLLQSKLPSKGKGDGKPDYELALVLKLFKPRGICTYQAEVVKDGKKSVQTKYKILKIKPMEKKK